MSAPTDFLQSLLQTGGIAALVSAAAIYLSKKIFEKKLDARFQSELEKIRAELTKQNLYIQEIVKKQTEYYPSLTEAVYRSRNAASKLLENLPKSNAGQRSDLGNLTLRITETLYEIRVYLPRSLFDHLHSYKGHLQNFIFDYDIVTGEQKGSPRDAMIKSLRAEFNEIDQMYQNIVSQIQLVLNVDKTT